MLPETPRERALSEMRPRVSSSTSISFSRPVGAAELRVSHGSKRAWSVNGTCTTNVAGMPAKRLPRGTRQRPVRVSWLIEERSKERLEKLADHAGVSAAVFLERVIDHLGEDLTDRGLPTWWPTPALKDGELDMPPE